MFTSFSLPAKIVSSLFLCFSVLCGAHDLQTLKFHWHAELHLNIERNFRRETSHGSKNIRWIHTTTWCFSSCFRVVSFFEKWKNMCALYVVFWFSNFPNLPTSFPTSFSFLRHSRKSRTAPSPTTDDPRFHQRTETSRCLHPKHWPQDWPREESSEVKTWQPQIEIHNKRSEMESLIKENHLEIIGTWRLLQKGQVIVFIKND